MLSNPGCLVLVFAMSLWSPIPSHAADQKNKEPIRVLCTEFDWTFTSGQQVSRTLKIFNDTPSEEAIDMEWSFHALGKAYAEGAETFVLQPGTVEEYSITFRAPAFAERTEGELVLTCLRGGEEVFRLVKTCFIRGEKQDVPNFNACDYPKLRIKKGRLHGRNHLIQSGNCRRW